VSHQLVVRPLAERDLLEAQQWYESQRSGLGADFRSTIAGLLGRVGANPKLYPEVYRGVRRAVVRRFPYGVYLVVSEERVVVIACLHSKRRPGLEHARLPTGEWLGA
jgi:plasmid stabilization system protein ParE